MQKEKANAGVINAMKLPQKASNFSLQILTQPPTEQRTRTAKEKRLFKTSVRVYIDGKHSKESMLSLRLIVTLLYADKTTTNRVPEAKAPAIKRGALLGGTTCKRLLEGNESKSVKTCTKTNVSYIDVVFEDLNLHEPSSRHHDREFCIAYKLLDTRDKRILAEVESGACYAYSHPKVLKRRRDVVLRALSTMQISQNERIDKAARRMHAVGGPFIQSPRLRVLFHFVWYKNGKVFKKKNCYADNLELFSENVLFFDAPTFPFNTAIQNVVTSNPFLAHVSISNDSRHFSNHLEVTYPSFCDQGMSVEWSRHPTGSYTDLLGSASASSFVNPLSQIPHQGATTLKGRHNHDESYIAGKSLREPDDQDSMEVSSALGTKRAYSPSNKEELESFDFDELLFLEDDILFDDGVSSVPFEEPFSMPFLGHSGGMINASISDHASEAHYDINAEKPKRKRMRSRM